MENTLKKKIKTHRQQIKILNIDKKLDYTHCTQKEKNSISLCDVKVFRYSMVKPIFVSKFETRNEFNFFFKKKDLKKNKLTNTNHKYTETEKIKVRPQIKYFDKTNQTTSFSKSKDKKIEILQQRQEQYKNQIDQIKNDFNITISNLQDEKIVYQKNLELLKTNNDQFKQQINTFEQERNLMISQINTLKGKFRVLLRIRPIDTPANNNTSILDLNKSLITIPNLINSTIRSFAKEKSQLKYIFDHIFQKNSSQNDIFEFLRSYIQQALAYQTVSLFAYGQTGAGKTFTITGPKQSKYKKHLDYCTKQWSTVFLIKKIVKKFCSHLSKYIMKKYTIL